MRSSSVLIVVALVIAVVTAQNRNCFNCPSCGIDEAGKGDFCPHGCGRFAPGDLKDDGITLSGPEAAFGRCEYGTNGNTAPGDSGETCTGSYCGGCVCQKDGGGHVNGYGDGTPYPTGTKILNDCCQMDQDICESLIDPASCPGGASNFLYPGKTVGDKTIDYDCVPGGDQLQHGNGLDIVVTKVGSNSYSTSSEGTGWGNCCTCYCNDDNDCTNDYYDPDLGECVFEERCPTLVSLDVEGHICQQQSCTPGSTDPGTCDYTDVLNGKCNTDGDPCTVGVCIVGDSGLECNEDKLDTCETGNTCETGVCITDVGCEITVIADNQACLGDGDGDKCTINDVCTDGVCGGTNRCESGQTCDPLVGQCADPTPLAVVGAGIAGAAICAAVAAAGLLNRRGDEEDSESWAKMSSGSSYGNKRMTTATQMSSFTRGAGAGDRSSRGSRSSRSSRSSKGKRMTGITQMSGASRGEMMGFEGASAGSRATMGTVASQMSRATRSTSGSRNSRSSRGSRSSKGRSNASHGTRSSGSRNSRSSRGRH